MPDPAPITQGRKTQLLYNVLKWTVGPESCSSKPVEIPQLVYTTLPSELTQDMARAQITEYGNILFSISPPEKGRFRIEAGNHTMSTTSPSGDGKLFWFIWQKQLQLTTNPPVSPCLSAWLPALERMWVVFFIVCSQPGATDRKSAPHGRNPYTVCAQAVCSWTW